MEMITLQRVAAASRVISEPEWIARITRLPCSNLFIKRFSSALPMILPMLPEESSTRAVRSDEETLA